MACEALHIAGLGWLAGVWYRGVVRGVRVCGGGGGCAAGCGGAVGEVRCGGAGLAGEYSEQKKRHGVNHGASC